MIDARPRHFERYVAIGDSSTEGLEDPDGQGGYRGWANRLAEHIARSQGRVEYANLAIRGRRTRQIRDQQLEPALAMRPDLATLFCGSNDAVAKGFDPEVVERDVRFMQERLIDQGATVLGFTLPDLTGVMPLGRLVRSRVEGLNSALRNASAATGALLVDFAAHAAASDPRIWNADGFHANARGHELIAAALGHALELPGADDSWMSEPPPSQSRSSIRGTVEDLGWFVKFFAPWVWRHLRGRSSGDGVSAKQPNLIEIHHHGETS